MVQVPLGILLKTKREQELHVSLRGMARLIGVTPTALKAIEDGETGRPSNEVLTSIADAYGIPRSDLALAAYGEYFEEVREPVLISA